MKKLLIFALAAMGMVACVKEEVTLLPQGDAISFESAFIDNATRVAEDPSITVNTLNGFNVWGFVKEYDGVIFDGVEVTKNNDVWSYDGTQYWVPNQPYYFAALAPMDSANWGIVSKATDAAAKLGLGTVDFTNVDGTEDLLYAKEMMTSKGLNEPNGAVKFQFQHLLSKVKFTFKNGFPTETASIKITNVKMTVPQEAEIDLAQADYSKAWTSYANTTTLSFGDVEKLAYTQSAEVAYERLTIPAPATQSYTVTFDVELFMGAQSVYTVAKTSVVTGAELEMGKAYNFSAEINPANLELEEIVFDVTAVEGWDAADNNLYVGETVGVSTAAELIAAIADEDVTAVVLTEDIDLGSTSITRAEANVTVEKKDFTIDGDGNTLTYTGSNRVIDFVANNNVIKNATIKNLTINITSSYCERGINFNNANGTLLIENVTFEGTAPTYAVNFPAKATGARATIKDSKLVGNIALNVWSENMKIDVINSELISVDDVDAEGYAAVFLNNDSNNAAEGTVINIEGGKITAKDQDGEPGIAVYNATETGKINVSETTEVVGAEKVQVAIVDFGTDQFYSMVSLQDAIDYVANNNNGKVRLTRDIELTKGVNIPQGATVEINLDGHKLYNSTDIWSDEEFALLSVVGSGAKLTIEGNGTVEAKEDDCYAVYVANGGEVTINGGTYIGNIHAVYVSNDGGVANLNGGYYDIKQKYNATAPYRMLLNCGDTGYKNGISKIIVKGGEYVGFDPANNDAEGAGTSYVATGYKSEPNGGNYVVVHE